MRTFLVMICSSIMFGCSSAPPHRAHTLMFAEEGQPVELKADPSEAQAEDVKEAQERQRDDIPETMLSNYENETRQQFEENLDDIFNGLKRSKKKRVLIYIHGGLNSAGGSLDRVHRLLSEAECSKNADQRKTYGCLTDNLQGSEGEGIQPDPVVSLVRGQNCHASGN